MKLQITLIAALLLGCTPTSQLETPKKPKPKVLPALRLHFTSVLRHGSCGIGDKKTVLVKTSIEWQKLWSGIEKNQSPQTKLPTVGFSKEKVVATFMGSQPTGGYSTQITNLWVNYKMELEVHILEKKPSRRVATTQALLPRRAAG